MTILKHIILLTALTAKFFAQDTTVTWLQNIDTTAFKYYNNKKYIPKDFYKYIDIKSVKEIANPTEEYTAGCVVQKGIPQQKLNWLVKDKKNHIVMKISCGGKAHRVLYYYLDTDKKKLNVNQLFFGHLSRDYTFGMTSLKIKLKEFEFLMYDPPSTDN